MSEQKYDKASLNNIWVCPRVKLTLKPLPSNKLSTLYLILSETMFPPLKILSCILGHDQFCIRIPHSSSSTRHKSFPPRAIVSHGVGLVYTMSWLQTILKLPCVFWFVLKHNISFSIELIVLELSLIDKIFIDIGNYFPFSLFAPFFEIALVDSFILILSIYSISIN